MNIQKAVQTRKNKGLETQAEIEDYLLKNPRSSNYQIVKNLKITSGMVQHHLSSLEKIGRISKRVSLLGNRGVVQYDVPESPVFKFYIEDIEALEWEEGQQLNLYLTNSSSFSVLPKISKNWDERCLARIPITLQTDKEGSYLVFPSNIIEFYGMNPGHIDQLIHYMPYPFLSGVRVDSDE